MLVTLSGPTGEPVVSDIEATVVHVAASVVGVAFAAPFDAAPALFALASTARAA